MRKKEEEGKEINTLFHSISARLKLSLVPDNCHLQRRQQLFLMIIQSDSELYTTTRKLHSNGLFVCLFVLFIPDT